MVDDSAYVVNVSEEATKRHGKGCAVRQGRKLDHSNEKGMEGGEEDLAL